jgi:class 3 adenylate cyclase/tetratricopeptide (TPR) repeat protein
LGRISLPVRAEMCTRYYFPPAILPKTIQPENHYSTKKGLGKVTILEGSLFRFHHQYHFVVYYPELVFCCCQIVMTERKRLEQAIAHLETQRATLGDAVVDASIATLREKLRDLEPSLLIEPQRKQVIILFADVSGFTTTSETMDAEDVSEMMNALWRRLDQAIIDYGGMIDKHIGDAVMALWGAQTARENDPEQAIRAALAMQRELAAFHDDRQMDLPVRIGINTGPVFLGRVGTMGEYTAMGDAVNLANRLEQAAPVGGILISHDTYRHVRGVFDVQSLEPIRVKGKAEPIQVYLVERASPRTFRVGMRGIEGIETRMIGRGAELHQLQDALYAVLDAAHGERRVVTVFGEAGVGKSRLLREFENSVALLPNSFCYFKGRASLEMQNAPYALIRDLFTSRFQIQDSDRARVVREKMEQGIGDVLRDGAARMQAHFIGQLLGFDFSDSVYLRGVQDDAQQLHDRALIYLSAFFCAATELAPTVIFLEDIHWADDSSLDVIEHLIQTLPDQRLLIVCLARPSLFNRYPDWGKGQAFHTRLQLHPLSEQDSRTLVEEILQKAERIPEELRELVVSGAEGNPFYVEELVKMLIEDGVIVKGQDRWCIEPANLIDMRIPPTLTGVLQARLDSLSTMERTVMQQASVVGRTFWDDTVRYLSSKSEPRQPYAILDVDRALAPLREREMIFRREDSSFAEMQEYIFRHAILRDVTYESVLKRVRRIYHALAAEWLSEHSGERAGEVTGLIAEHLELAGQAEQAIVYLRRAGEQAAARFANSQAVTYLSRALDLLPEDGVRWAIERYGLLLAREKVYDLQGAREAQYRDLVALIELTEALDDGGRQAAERCAEAALRQANYAEATSDYVGAVVAAQQATVLARTAGALASEAAGYLWWGQALWRQGDYEEARTQLERALSLAQTARLPNMEADSLLNLGIVADYQGDLTVARVYLEQALRLHRDAQHGDQRGESRVLNNLGFVAFEQGDYAGARAYWEQTLSLCREIGDRQGEGKALGNLGETALQQGDYAEAMAYTDQALDLAREIGDRLIEGNTLSNLGAMAREHGDYSSAQAYYKQALDLYREIGDRGNESVALANLGLTFHCLEDNPSAREYSQQALVIAQELGAKREQQLALTHLGHALVGLGCLAEAADIYRQAIALQRELDQHNLAIETLAGLARVFMAQERLPEALVIAEEILNYLETGSLDGTEEPFRIYLTCYRVLTASQDPRAEAVLSAARTRLRERAAKIADEKLRRSYLENVAAHREIMSERRDG